MTGLADPTHLGLVDAVKNDELMRKPGAVIRTPASTMSGMSGMSAIPECDAPVTSTVRRILEGGNAPRPQSVIVHARNVNTETDQPVWMEPPPGMAPVTLEQVAGIDLPNGQALLGRWKLALTVLAKVFSDEISQESGSVLVQLSGFPVRESRFRKEMEKLRNAQSKDLVLEVDRERHLLLQQTIKQLNQYYGRRSSCTSSGLSQTVHKVKVTFKDEPGEGSGVARSFYAAIAEAILSSDRLPSLEHCQMGPVSNTRMQQQLLNRLRSRERVREMQRRRGSTGLSSGSSSTTRRHPLSADAPPFFLPGDPAAGGNVASPETQAAWDPSKQTLGERLYPKVRNLRPVLTHSFIHSFLRSFVQCMIHCRVWRTK